MQIRHVHRACMTAYDSHARKAAGKPPSNTHCDTFHARTRTSAEQHASLTTTRVPYVCGAQPGNDWQALYTSILNKTNAPCKHDVFNINMVTRDLVYTYKIVNGLFPHEFSAQVPDVCGHNGVMHARVVDGPPRTTS